MNLPMKTFRFMVYPDKNNSNSFVVEQRSLNAYQAQKALEAQYGPNAKVSFYGMVSDK